MSNKKPKAKKYEDLVLERVGAGLMILLLVVAAEICAFSYGRLADQFRREGVVATGIVTAVEQYEALDVRDFYEEFGDVYEDGDIITVISYRYEDEAGNVYTDETRSRNLAVERIPEIGSGFEMRYLASDPETHEARIGHLESNVAALHWIAAFFAALAVGVMIWGVISARREFNSTAEKRKRRQAELKQSAS